MYDPDIPGVGWRMHYDRLERVYRRLQAGNKSSIDYGDDLAHYFQDCLHLADWIGRDETTGTDFKQLRKEVEADRALRDAADLGNASKHFVRREGERHTYMTSNDVTVYADPGRTSDISHVVTREDGTTFSAQDLVREAFDSWQLILKRHHLL